MKLCNRRNHDLEERIMALIKCPECGKKNVSDSAIACPNCGFSIKEYFKNVNVKEEMELREAKGKEAIDEIKNINHKEKVNQNESNKLEKSKPKNRMKFILFLVFLVVIIVSIIFVKKMKNVDTEAPKIVVNNNTIAWMSEPDLLSKDFISIVDNTDSNPTVELMDGSVDTAKDGTYIVKYKVSDEFGNSEIVDITYIVDSGLPSNLSKEKRELYAMIQGVWNADALWTNNEVKKMIQFDGMNYIYRDSNGIEYTGKYSISTTTRPTYDDEDCLFCISLSDYSKNPNNLFYYEKNIISDRYANSEWFEDYSEYKKINSPIMEKVDGKVFIVETNSSETRSNFIISGTVKNTTDKVVYSVKVKVTLSNEYGDVLNTESSYVVGDEGLAPGESSTFTCYIDKVEDGTIYNAYVYDYQY